MGLLASYGDDPASAITREKEIKKWRRDWKIRLIEENNTEWRDLYDDLVNKSPSFRDRPEARPGIHEHGPLENGFPARGFAAPRNDGGGAVP